MLGDLIGSMFMLVGLSTILFVILISLECTHHYVTSTILSALAVSYLIYKNPDMFNNFDIIQIVAFIIAYFGIGIAWSIYRYYKFVLNVCKYTSSPLDSSYVRDYSSPSYKKYDIIAWITNWPVSFVGYSIIVLYDLVGFMFTGYLVNMFKKVQTYCINKAVAELEKNKQETELK